MMLKLTASWPAEDTRARSGFHPRKGQPRSALQSSLFGLEGRLRGLVRDTDSRGRKLELYGAAQQYAAIASVVWMDRHADAGAHAPGGEI